MPRSPFDRLMRRCVKRFSTPGIYIRDDLELSIEGVFDNDYEEVTFDDGATVMSRGPAFGIHANAIPFEPRKGDRLRVNGAEYRVKRSEPDSEFGIHLVLTK